MRGVFATHFYSIASGDVANFYQVRDLMHNAAKPGDFAEQVTIIYYFKQQPG